MILHIFKKDVKLLWRLALAVAVLSVLPELLLLKMGQFIDYERGLYVSATAVSTSCFLARGLLMIAAVQQDAIPGVRLDWLTRPIRRKDLLLAKMLFAVVIVQAPVLLADLFEGFVHGFPAGRVFSAALSRSAVMLLVFDLPMLAFASITKNMLEAITGAVIIVVAVLTSTILIQDVPRAAGIPHFGGWIADLIQYTILAAGGAAVLGLQYFRRQTTRSRALTAVVLVLAVASTLLPARAAFAIERTLSHEPSTGEGIMVGFAPAMGRMHSVSTDTESVYLPVQVSGLPPGSILQAEGAQLRLTEANGHATQLPEYGGWSVRNDPPESSARGAYMPPLYLYRMVSDQIKNENVRLEIDVTFSLLRPASSYSIAALDGDERIPDLGSCATRASYLGRGIELGCVQAGPAPACMVYYLERTPALFASTCMGPIEHSLGRLAPDAFTRSRSQLTVTRLGPETSLKRERLVLKTYETEAHLRRHIVIPDIRLADWLPITN